MKKKSETKDRIVETAIKLFYENGYSETGINEILDKSSTFKKSLYTHFPSKTDLGIHYINEIQGIVEHFIQKLLNKYPVYEDFVKAWIRLVKNKLSKDFHLGCPLANMPSNSPELSLQVKNSFEKLKQPFINYFVQNYQFSESASLELSEEILFLYEGALTTYKMDPNKKYFDYLQKHLMGILTTK